MTAIVGIVSGGRVWLGGDSAGLSGMDLSIHARPKVFRRKGVISGEDVLIGYSSSFRMGDLLQYRLELPGSECHASQDAYMATAFVDAVRECFQKGGYARRESEAEEGGQFLVGYRGHLYRIESDYQVHESAGGFDAVGCGAAYTLGALGQSFYGSANRPPEPVKRLRQALQVAERFSAGVRGPFTIIGEHGKAEEGGDV